MDESYLFRWLVPRVGPYFFAPHLAAVYDFMTTRDGHDNDILHRLLKRVGPRLLDQHAVAVCELIAEDVHTEHVLLPRLLERVGPSLFAPYQGLVAELSAHHISALPLDILTRILSFVELSDVRNVMLVCHRWYEASRCKEFWKQHVMQRIEKVIPQEHFIIYVKNSPWDPFFFSDETLREQVEWLFIRGSLGLHGHVGDDPVRGKTVCLSRYSNQDMRVWWKFDIRRFSAFRALFVHSPGRHRYCQNGKTKVLSYEWGGPELLLNVDFVRGTPDSRLMNGPIEVLCDKRPSCGEFSGQAARDKSYTPHGYGTWKFHNGDTFTSDTMAAFDGKPHGIGVNQHGQPVEYMCGAKVVQQSGDGKRRKLEIELPI